MEALRAGVEERYELVADIARGSTSDLVLVRACGAAGFVRHHVIKRVRGDKIGDATFLRRFVAEARLAATLHHINIVAIHDIAQERGVPYFAMEYVHGEDLRTLLAHVHARRESVPIQHVLAIGCAVAAALHHAHEHRIVHREVSPSNILIGYDGAVKVIDFGGAGKAPYLSPEQCTQGRVDRRADVFGLGVVLYELATARRLFKGSGEDARAAIARAEVPPLDTQRSDVSPALSAVIMQALARAPEDRYDTAGELGAALEACAASAGLAPSGAALARYLVQQLGERREPWLPGGCVRATAPVDFDDDPREMSGGWETKVDQEMPSRARELDRQAAAAEADELLEEAATTEMSSQQLATAIAALKLGEGPPPQPHYDMTALVMPLPLPRWAWLGGYRRVLVAAATAVTMLVLAAVLRSWFLPAEAAPPRIVPMVPSEAPAATAPEPDSVPADESESDVPPTSMHLGPTRPMPQRRR